ncbi:hypothetical protein FDUTEX481_00988 [Tolypothrix sp. PCC 7601]|nr:hypothetical protein FDUTEX481_00988 [Tolypothrix sp. PCC 7601]
MRFCSENRICFSGTAATVFLAIAFDVFISPQGLYQCFYIFKIMFYH